MFLCTCSHRCAGAVGFRPPSPTQFVGEGRGGGRPPPPQTHLSTRDPSSSPRRSSPPSPGPCIFPPFVRPGTRPGLTMREDNEYLLGTDDEELLRLGFQHQVWA